MALAGTVFTAVGSYTQTGSSLDMEAYKKSFDDVIAAYTDLIGGWTFELIFTDLSVGASKLCKIAAKITFENMIDACYFALLWKDANETLPDYVAAYQATAASESLVWA